MTGPNITDKTLALLKVRLHMPLVVRDLLVTDKAADPDTQYALSEAMSNMYPAQALLCAAITLRDIAAFDDMAATDQTFLHMECDRIIERYAPKDKGTEDYARAPLPALADDMDQFSELLSLCHMSYDVMKPKMAVILRLITAQIEAHSMIVDEIINLTNKKGGKAILPLMLSGYETDNVIAFPSHLT